MNLVTNFVFHIYYIIINEIRFFSYRIHQVNEETTINLLVTKKIRFVFFNIMTIRIVTKWQP